MGVNSLASIMARISLSPEQKIERLIFSLFKCDYIHFTLRQWFSNCNPLESLTFLGHANFYLFNENASFSRLGNEPG